LSHGKIFKTGFKESKLRENLENLKEKVLDPSLSA
jgi:hypothetical protein